MQTDRALESVLQGGDSRWQRGAESHLTAKASGGRRAAQVSCEFPRERPCSQGAPPHRAKAVSSQLVLGTATPRGLRRGDGVTCLVALTQT